MKASTTRDLLLHLLQPADPSSSLCREITPAQWHALITLAHQQRVTALLYQRINDHGLTSLLPTDVQTTLQKSYRTNALRNLKLYHQLIELLKALQAAEIPVIVLKGSYLGQAVYSHPALRFMVDFDLMVPEEALEATLEILATLGYRPLTPVILENSKALGHHLPRFVL